MAPLLTATLLALAPFAGLKASTTAVASPTSAVADVRSAFGAAQAVALPQQVPPTTAKPAPAPPVTAPSSDYVVGPQDIINITIYGEPTLSGRIRVDYDGTFSFQYLGRVQAEGLTTAQIEANLKKALQDGYLRNPQVSVEVVDYRSQSVYVQGEVRAPNKYAVQGNSTLMDILTLAGSVTANAGNYVLITHAKPGTGQPLGPAADSATADLRVSLRDIQTGKAQNIKIKDGDTIYVPKAERIFVVGAVRNSGAVTFEEGMTVYQAVSLAGGITEKGANRFGIRRLIKGQLKEIGAKAEDPVQPGDTVVVRNRRL